MSIKGKLILLVEDDADFARATTVRLKAQGYALVQAGDGISAISTARKIQPDLIIVDLGLPGGDGFLVIERLKQHVDLMLIPVIVVSARDPFMNESRALVLGAQAFLQKPVENDELLSAIERAISNRMPITGKSILLVEDDVDFARATTVRLKAQGYAVAQVGDAVSAITMAQQIKPDLIIVDLGLPAGDGFLVIERLKQHSDLMRIPVIVVSARDPFMNEGRALAAGAQAFLQKPVENDELLFTIERAIAPGVPLQN